jgi:hypothetical protein
VSATRPPAYDERYAAPVEASRRGAHRARPNPLTSVLPVVAGMAVVVLVVVGAFTLLGDRGADSNVNAAPTTQPSASSSAAPSASASSPAATTSAPADPSAAVDKTIELRVLNSTETGGLAAKFSEQLKTDDWTIGTTGDSNQRGLETTLVYYAKSSQKATADALVESLGFGKVKKSPGNAGSTGVTIVLGEDAAAA